MGSDPFGRLDDQVKRHEFMSTLVYALLARDLYDEDDKLAIEEQIEPF